ncbi:MAG: hypothetical protein U0637_12280 [Phycisphaerales bacterium]
MKRSSLACAMMLAATGLTMLMPACSSGQPGAKPRAERTGFAFWPQFPDDPRVQFLRSLGGSAELAAAKSSTLENVVFGKEAEKDAVISKPYGVAIRNGIVYVCDMRGKSLVALDFKKKQTRIMGSTGSNRLGHPVAVAVADDGEIYVAESERGAIVVFDAQERYSRAIGFPKFKPVALAIHGDRLYATDMLAQAVQVLDRKSGKQLGTIGSVGDNDGQFRLPMGVATDKQGNVYVVDMMRGRLQKFSPDGKLLLAGGQMGDSTGTFARPKHIAVDNDGLVYVVDAAFQNVQIFDDQFRVLTFFGAAGDHPGAMNMPAGICVDDGSIAQFAGELHEGFNGKRVVAVTNQFGDNKVCLYALGEKKPGFEAADFARVAVKINTGIGATEDTKQMQEQGQDDLKQPETTTPAPDAPTQPVAPK